MQFVADTHTHTLASTHAYSTVLENARVAADRGLLYLAMTDHVPNDIDAPHIWHFRNMEPMIDRTLFGVKMLFGAETSIVGADGSLNIENCEIDYLDWIIASVHFPVEGKPMDYTEVYAAVAKNPYVDVIGHCANEYYPFDYDKVLPLFRDNNKLVEINEGNITQKQRAQNYRILAKKCLQYDVPIIVNSDAHFCNRVGEFYGAIEILQSISYPEELIINSTEGRFENFLKSRGKDGLWSTKK
jgi:putative hydrolase